MPDHHPNRFPPHPDLNLPHTAVSLHFKAFEAFPEFLWNNRTHSWHRRGEVDTLIDVYADRVDGWFFAYGDQLKHQHDSGFVVFMLALSHLEGSAQYRRGESSKNKSMQFFCEALHEVFPHLSKEHAEIVYQDARCGLFHDGMTKHRVFIDNTLQEPISVSGQEVLVCPNRFFEAVRLNFTHYIAKLRDPLNHDLRARFRSAFPGAGAT